METKTALLKRILEVSIDTNERLKRMDAKTTGGDTGQKKPPDAKPKKHKLPTPTVDGDTGHGGPPKAAAKKRK